MADFQTVSHKKKFTGTQQKQQKFIPKPMEATNGIRMKKQVTGLYALKKFIELMCDVSDETIRKFIELVSNLEYNLDMNIRDETADIRDEMDKLSAEIGELVEQQQNQQEQVKQKQKNGAKLSIGEFQGGDSKRLKELKNKHEKLDDICHTINQLYVILFETPLGRGYTKFDKRTGRTTYEDGPVKHATAVHYLQDLRTALYNLYRDSGEWMIVGDKFFEGFYDVLEEVVNYQYEDGKDLLLQLVRDIVNDQREHDKVVIETKRELERCLHRKKVGFESQGHHGRAPALKAEVENDKRIKELEAKLKQLKA